MDVMPSSTAIRPASRKVRWSSSMPLRIFTVTGRLPAPLTASRRMERSRLRL
jgi:hypothetical protein